MHQKQLSHELISFLLLFGKKYREVMILCIDRFLLFYSRITQFAITSRFPIVQKKGKKEEEEKITN
jgi:hypothetical protein